jgi:membrane associated rhomboid family serine protease
MIPLRDNIPARTTPIVNYALIAACGLVFAAQLLEYRDTGPGLVERFGMIPARIWNPEQDVTVVEIVPVHGQIERIERNAQAPPFSPWLTLVTCIFLHGGWMHFLGNVWFLFIFGDNVEDRMGHWAYLLFYFFCGVAASAAHLLSNPQSGVPTIGASGAIAGVMGAYFLLYPRAMVLSAVPLFFFLEMVVLPAPVFLGIWFVIQFFQGTAAITSTQSGGVAWWAHIGGFAAGYAIAAILRTVGETRPPVEQTRPNADRVQVYRYRRY